MARIGYSGKRVQPSGRRPARRLLTLLLVLVMSLSLAQIGAFAADEGGELEPKDSITVTVRYVSVFGGVELREPQSKEFPVNEDGCAAYDVEEFLLETLVADGITFQLVDESMPLKGVAEKDGWEIELSYEARGFELAKYAAGLDEDFTVRMSLTITPVEDPYEPEMMSMDPISWWNVKVESGSMVVDGMGYVKDQYNFDFVNDRRRISQIAVQVGDSQKIQGAYQEEYSSEEAGIHIYTFGLPLPMVNSVEGGEDFDPDSICRAYPYVLCYEESKDDPSREKLTWYINRDVTVPIQLLYQLKLVDYQKTPGVHGEDDWDGSKNSVEWLDENTQGGLYTNSYAELWRLHHYDEDGIPCYLADSFPMPTVSYEIEEEEAPVVPVYRDYDVVVNYLDKDSGGKIAESQSVTLRQYSDYDVSAYDAIAIPGYTYVETSGDALRGVLNGDKVINVYYSKDGVQEVEEPAPTEPQPTPPVTPAQPPKTGDSMGLWTAAAAASGMGLLWLALSGRKRREEA